MGYAAKSERIGEVNIVFEKTFRLNTATADMRQQDAGRQGGISVFDVNLVVRPESGPRRPVSQSETTETTPTTKTSREISGNGAGQIEIENATGRIINNKMTQDMVERAKLTTQNQILRPISGPEPITTHKVTTFQMTKIAEGKPAQPADANEKGAPSI